MALSVKEINILSEYISGVMDRADHHAGNVEQITLALAGAILWRKDDSDIKVFERDNETKNVLWVHIGGKRYAFSYDHIKEKIEMRENSTQGVTLHKFDNLTPLGDLVRIFKSL